MIRRINKKTKLIRTSIRSQISRKTARTFSDIKRIGQIRKNCTHLKNIQNILIEVSRVSKSLNEAIIPIDEKMFIRDSLPLEKKKKKTLYLEKSSESDQLTNSIGNVQIQTLDPDEWPARLKASETTRNPLIKDNPELRNNHESICKPLPFPQIGYNVAPPISNQPKEQMDESQTLWNQLSSMLQTTSAFDHFKQISNKQQERINTQQLKLLQTETIFSKLESVVVNFINEQNEKKKNALEIQLMMKLFFDKRSKQ